ncbi:Cap1p [Ascoidea rubescens DSM 1968]|uniref:F-actin-capping protein subunit alpha n=1 Tax=Ascoidea rubescens DSM 1968 TaxID=1344418 RepID=A0A1D2VNC1_9ASCO|nr:subunits of heterodimeric actin filament capping protein Capz [Ascoidea rubescens DSM 1968]ODV63100.1 subunits of heterodimeric actin filament capping protein Capz [Ascoidea rubescens DSM 1968]
MRLIAAVAFPSQKQRQQKQQKQQRKRSNNSNRSTITMADDFQIISDDFINDAPPGETANVVNDLAAIVDNKDITSQLHQSILASILSSSSINFKIIFYSGSNLILSKFNYDETTNQFFDYNINKSFDVNLISNRILNVDNNLSSTLPYDLKNLNKSLASYINQHYPSVVKKNMAYAIFPIDNDHSYTQLFDKEFNNQFSKEFENTPVPRNNTITDDLTDGNDDESNENDLNIHQDADHYDKFIIIILNNKFNPSNFWNGSWSSYYVYSNSMQKLFGKISIDIHYYEDGNVRLKTFKTLNQSNVSKINIINSINAFENNFQNFLSLKFLKLNQNGFKSLRRQLPVTRSKIQWGKGYALGKSVVIND